MLTLTRSDREVRDRHDVPRRCWCGTPIALRPGPGRPAEFCSRAHCRSLQPASRRRYKRRAIAQRREAALPRPVAVVPDAWSIENLARAVYRQAVIDGDAAWLADRAAQGLWGDIAAVLRAATVTGMD